MVKGQDFIEKGVAAYEGLLKNQKEKYLKKLALELNMDVITEKRKTFESSDYQPV